MRLRHATVFHLFGRLVLTFWKHSKPCVRRPLKNRPKKILMRNGGLMKVPLEHSAMLLTCNKMIIGLENQVSIFLRVAVLHRFYCRLNAYILIKTHFVWFVWFDSLRPINNLSVIKGRVFLGWTSTKLGLMFLLKDTTQWRRWGSNPRPLGLESSTLPLSHCAP